MDQARSVTATFTLDPVFFSLGVTLAGDGSGSVSSDPAGIDCPTDCAEDYLEDSVVTLTATPASGSSFAGWSGDCSGSVSLRGDHGPGAQRDRHLHPGPGLVQPRRDPGR